MREKIEVIYENGVLRPLGPMPAFIHEDQRLTVTIEGQDVGSKVDGADPTISLETVRQALAKVPVTLAELVRAERDER